MVFEYELNFDEDLTEKEIRSEIVAAKEYIKDQVINATFRHRTNATIIWDVELK